MVIHANTIKVDVNEFLRDWWIDLMNLNADATRDYAFAFSNDPICIITLHNARLSEDSWVRQKMDGVTYDPLVRFTI